MNQKINHSRLMSFKEQDELTFRNTNSNENCKETLKKFGILQITTELVLVFIRNSDKHGAKTKLAASENFVETRKYGNVNFSIFKYHDE